MSAPHRLLLRAALATSVLLLLFAPHALALEIKRFKLDSGAVLLVAEQHQLPMMTLAIAFDAGARRDPPGKAGLAALTAASLTQGTKTLAAADFNRQVDFMGSTVSVGAGRDYAQAGFASLKRYEKETLHLLAETLREPGLREADVERKRAEQVAGIKANEEQPEYVAGVAFQQALFGNGPYGHPAEGYADSVASLTPADVRQFYETYYKLGGAVIAVVGDVEASEVKAELEQELGGPAGSVAPEPAPPPPTVAPGIHPKLIDRNVAQATLLLGSVGVDRANPDYYRLQVMNYILGGGGFASRLMKVVRSQAGLAYGIGSGFDAGLFTGPFAVVTQTKNESSNEAVRLILEQLRAMQEAPVSDDELSSAKKYLIGSFPLKLDRQSAIASFMLQVELYGLGLDYAERYPKLIGAVTASDVQAVARKYLHPDALYLVAVADLSEAKIVVARDSSAPQGASDASAGAGAAPH